MKFVNQRLRTTLKIFLFLLLGLVVGIFNLCSTSLGNWWLLKSRCPAYQLPNASDPVQQPIKQDIAQNSMIRIDVPRPMDTISSPLQISGQARGSWFFEASFPVVLTDWDGKIIAEGIAQAQDDWMTDAFVPFVATLNFETPAFDPRGYLILKKDNPSGLSENDASIELPLFFSE